jgi:hypothetical protein
MIGPGLFFGPSPGLKNGVGDVLDLGSVFASSSSAMQGLITLGDMAAGSPHGSLQARKPAGRCKKKLAGTPRGSSRPGASPLALPSADGAGRHPPRPLYRPFEPTGRSMLSNRYDTGPYWPPTAWDTYTANRANGTASGWVSS